MVRENEIRASERAVEMPPAADAGLVFIGRIRTPWTSRLATPRQGRADGPICRIEIFEPWVPALDGLDGYSRVEPRKQRRFPGDIFVAHSGAT
jgi:tRNA (adenine37-N6)-methyltransferase